MEILKNAITLIISIYLGIVASQSTYCQVEIFLFRAFMT